jgi:hypothetical protein
LKKSPLLVILGELKKIKISFGIPQKDVPIL